MICIVIPGFTGSGLTGHKKNGQEQGVWIDFDWLRVYGIDDLEVSDGGTLPGPLARLGLIFPFGYVLGLYTGLTQALREQAGVKLVTQWAWDWRLDLVNNGLLLGNFLRPLLAKDKVTVFAHSAGGLVARLCYNNLRNTGLLANWQRTVYLGTPHGGSYNATQGLACFLPELTWWQMLALGVGIGQRRIMRPFSNLDSLTQRIAQVLASWPSLPQLMPNPGGQYAGLDTSAADAFNQIHWNEANPYVQNHSWLQAGLTFWNTMNALPAQPAGTEVDVVSSGYTTVNQYNALDILGLPGGYRAAPGAGDGIVPIERQQHGGVSTITISAAHQNMQDSGELIRALPQLLSATPPVTEFLLDAPVNLPTPPAARVPGESLKPPAFFPATIRRGDP